MSLTASDKGNAEFAIVPEGVYTGRAFKIIDLGTQTSTGMFGTKDQHKVMISWELLGSDAPKMEDGRPFSVTQWYTVSLHEKSKLRADLESWRGRKFSTEELAGFDLGSVMGAYCLLQIVHDETGKYANINSIMAYKGEKPKPVNDNVVFDIDKPDMKVFESLSDNMKAKITNTPEWAAYENPPKPTVNKTAVQNQQSDMGTLEDEPVNLDDIPF